MAADVFLSYRNTEERRTLVKRLAFILRAYEISVWWDYGLEAGESYRAEITRELSQARIVTPLWCSESVKSKWVMMEAELGKDKLVPARLQYCIVPLEFEGIQAADLIGWNGAASNARLLSFVRKICERLGKKTQAPADTVEELAHLPLIQPLPERVAPSAKPAEPVLDPIFADLRSTWEKFPARDDKAEVERFLARVRVAAAGSGLEFEIEHHLHKLGKSAALAPLVEPTEPERAAPIDFKGDWTVIQTLSNTETIASAAFSSDGLRLFICSRGLSVGFRDVATGEWSSGIWDDHLPGAGIASPDGRRIIVVSSIDDQTRMWDVGAVRVIRYFSRLYCIRYSVDGSMLIAGSMDGEVKILTEQGGPIKALKAGDKSIQDVALSPDGKLAVSASSDGSVKIWSVEKGDLLHAASGFPAPTSVQFSPDGKLILAAAADGTTLFDAETFTPNLKVQDGRSARFSPDGKFFVTAGRSSHPAIWGTTGSEPIVTLQDPDGFATFADFSPDGAHIVTVRDKIAKIWRAPGAPAKLVPVKRTQNYVRWNYVKSLYGHLLKVRSASYSPDGDYIVSVAEDNTLGVWYLATGNRVAKMPIDDPRGAPTYAEVSPDGSKIAIASESGIARIFSFDRKLLTTLKGHKPGFLRARFSPDGARVVTASDDGTAKIWNTTTGEVLRTLAGHKKGLTDASFSPDGKFVATGSLDEWVKLWTADRGEEVQSIPRSDVINGIDFSPDGKTLVTACRKWTQVVEVLSGKTVATMGGGGVWSTSARFSRDGRRIVTSAWEERRAYVWDASSGERLATMQGDDLVPFADFSPDGKHVVTADGEEIRIWAAP